MSGYFGKFFTAFSSALEFNTATLSGAIDIVVIEDDQGRRQCSPFHVRFGKLQLLKSRGIPVEIELNGHRTNLRMLLGAAGEAYFYNPKCNALHDDNEVASPEVPPHMSMGAELEMASPKLGLPVRAVSMPIPLPEIPVLGTVRDERVMHLHPSATVEYLEEGALENAQQPSRSAAGKPKGEAFRSIDGLSSMRSHVKETTDTDYPFGYISDSEVELTRNERAGKTEVVDEPRSPPLFSSQRKWSSTVAAQNPPVAHGFERFGKEERSFVVPCADPAQQLNPAVERSKLSHHTVSSPIHSSPAKEKESFTPDETFIATRMNHEEDGADKNLISEPRSIDGSTIMPHQLKDLDGSVTVSDTLSDIVGEEDGKLDCRSVDGYDGDEDNVEDLQERVAYVLSRSHRLSLEDEQNTDSTGSKVRAVQFEADGIQEHKEKAKVASREGVLDMSLCGKLIKAEMSEPQIAELFDRHRVTYEEFSSNPNVLYDPALLVRIDNSLVELRVAVPFIFSVLAFNERMDVDSLAQVTALEPKEELPKSPPTPSRRFRWFGWGSSAVVGEPLLDEEDLNTLEKKNAAEKEEEERERETLPEVAEGKSEQKQLQSNENDTGVEREDRKGTTIEKDSRDGVPDQARSEVDDALNTSTPPARGVRSAEEIMDPAEIPQALAVPFSELDPEALSLRPTQEELQSLNLLPGANTIRFVVESSSVELHCRIFLWSSHTKVVISDVDGTITRSDVLGHLLPAVGRDWSQVGVAGLYTHIEKNGYKLLYLTARPIGQASQTRDFLKSVTQGSAKLPNGPVLMSPNRLVESFTREVIRRKPQEFKIAALREIRSLFSPDYNPFHAGFGNRDTDVISYRSVGLIPQRIFVVNPKGELVVTKAKYESAASYSTLQDLVESVFPDISGQSGLEKIKALTESSMYNDWKYWKAALPSVDLDELLEPTKS